MIYSFCASKISDLEARPLDYLPDSVISGSSAWSTTTHNL